MKVYILVFLHTVADATQHGLRRSLEENDRNESGEASGDNDDYNNYNGDNRMDQYKQQWEDAQSRVNEDLNGMWSTTPSEWGDEYWEVLLSALFIFFAALLCLCCICCIPCCERTYDYEKPRIVGTKEDIQHRRETRKSLQEPILPETESEESEEAAEPQSESQPQPQGEGTSRRFFWQEIDWVYNSILKVGGEKEKEPESDKHGRPINRIRRKTLLQEIILVWQDFFENGLIVPESKSSRRNRMMRKNRRRKLSSSRKDDSEVV
jgi:hypothetical protein